MLCSANASRLWTQHPQEPERMSQNLLRTMFSHFSCFSLRSLKWGMIKSSTVTATRALMLDDTVLKKTKKNATLDKSRLSHRSVCICFCPLLYQLLLHRPLHCILSATKKQFSSSYAQASPQGAAVGSSHKQARDSRVGRQHIHDKVGQQLVHIDKRFRLASPGRSTHSGGWETAGSVYLIRTVHIPVWKRIAVLVNGVHGEARKHGQAHRDPQANHVHIQRPETWKTQA